MIFYATMDTETGEHHAYIFRSKKELESVAHDGILRRTNYKNIQYNKTNISKKSLRDHFNESGVKFAETYKSDDWCYKDYDFCLPVIEQSYLFKPMFY